MSLIAWWPLNGSTENQGLEQITLSSGTPTYSAGKIGQCLSGGNLVYTAPTDLMKTLTTTNTFSIAFWFKLSNADTASWVVRLYGNDSNGNSRGLWHTANGTYAHWAYGGAGYNINSASSIEIYDSEWHHIALAVNGLNVKLYVDRNYENEINTNKTDVVDLSTTYIQINGNIGNLNDVRIYNHCLSAKEIDEMAKGLILHYPMMMPDGVIGGEDLTSIFTDPLTIYDCSGYKRNGTYTATSKPSWDNDSAVGLGSYSLTASQYVYEDNFVTTGHTAEEFTASIWFKTSTLNSTKPNLISIGANASFRFRLASTTSIWYYVKVGSTMCDSIYSTKTLTDNIWHMFTITFNKGVVTAYIDGAQIGTTNHSSFGTVITFTENKLILGGHTLTGERFVGSLNDLKIYATALSATDIEKLYKVRYAIADNGSVFSYSYVEDDSANVTYNKSGVMELTEIQEDDTGTYRIFDEGVIKTIQVLEWA